MQAGLQLALGPACNSYSTKTNFEVEYKGQNKGEVTCRGIMLIKMPKITATMKCTCNLVIDCRKSITAYTWGCSPIAETQ